MPQDFRETVLNHLQCSHAALDTANAVMTKQAEVEASVNALIPNVVEALIVHDRIDPANREKAAAALKDPVKVLSMLIKAADAKNTVKPQPMGAPAGPEKTAAAEAPRRRYLGERTSEKTAADHAFERTLLGG